MSRRQIPQFAPYLAEEEVEQIVETLRSNWITEGPKTREFETLIAERVGVKHAIAVNNGTVALYLGLKILGIGPGDEVIVPDFTFIASANAVVLAGAKPVFADIDARTFGLDSERIPPCISPRTRAIMPVHIYGQAADMPALSDVARRYGLAIIEDAAQGIGVTFKGKHVGSFGDVACMSFYADKTMTTGEGGMVLTNDDAMADECVILKNQGRPVRGRYTHEYIGYNFRLTDLQAAVGLAQLSKLETIIQLKKRNERLYHELLADVSGVEFPYKDPRGFDVPFRINILVEDPEGVRLYLEEHGISSRRFFYPLHLQPCYGVRADCTNAVRAYERGLSLPSAAGLTEEEIRYVCEKLADYFDKGVTR